MDKTYWQQEERGRAALLLLSIPGIGRERGRKLLNLIGDEREIPPLISLYYPLFSLRPGDWDTLREQRDRQWDILRRARAAVVVQGESLYPPLLQDLASPPLILFIYGDLSTLNKNFSALVGSRRSDQSLLSLARDVSSYLSERLSVVVSGLASGCDTAGHVGALRGKGGTVAILPCGFSHIYPKENRRLASKIVHHGGLLISEYPPLMEPAPFRFIERDRLIGGFSKLLLLMESSISGGAMYAVRQTQALLRPLFVYRSLDSQYRNGGNTYLIERGEGVPFSSLEDLPPLLDHLL